MEQFPWGQVVKEYHISGLVIVEFHPWKTRGSELLTGNPDMTKTEFNIPAQNRGYDTLDKAIIGGICYKYTGDDAFAPFIYKALDMPEASDD